MARKRKIVRETPEGQRDATRKRDGWKAARDAARRDKQRRRRFESGS